MRTLATDSFYRDTCRELRLQASLCYSFPCPALHEFLLQFNSSLYSKLFALHCSPPLCYAVICSAHTQEGCCLAFSTGVPLLGSRHRKHVHRCFSLAAQILQDLKSPLARLRAQLHLEVSTMIVAP